MTRWKASAIHFAISLVALAVIVAIVIRLWYPPQLFAMAKVGQLLSILASVDLVLGPLLTLLVYKQGKKSLKFDLSVIGMLQVAAMAFGLLIVWQSRPVYLVAISDRFRLVFANEIDPASAAEAPPAYRSSPALGPEAVAAPLPDDPTRRLETMLQTMAGQEIFLQPTHYVPYPPNDPAFLTRAVPAAQALELAAPADRKAWSDAFRKYAGVGSPGIMPLQSSRGSATILLDTGNGRILGYSRLDPWAIIEARERRQRQKPR
jgi:hypothetical protein